MTGKLDYRIFSDLPRELVPEDLLVFNNTRTIPDRLYRKLLMEKE